MEATDSAGSSAPKVVLLCGGLGTRMREETEYRPKPMVEVGSRPVLWHIMKLFAHHGLTEFILCAGYKGQIIKDYFLDYEAHQNDFTVVLGQPDAITYHGPHSEDGWRVTVCDTGAETGTGGRVKRVAGHLRAGPFILTYGDGVADVDISALLAFHAAHGRLATVTTTRPLSRFGVVELDGDDTVSRFREKPQGDEWVSCGFFVLEPGALGYITDDGPFEEGPLERLAADGQIVAFRHDGFWQPMDTYRESLLLNRMWDAGDPAWAVWR